MKNIEDIKDYIYYLIFGLALILIIAIIKPVASIFIMLIYIYIVYKIYTNIELKNKDNLKYIENLNREFDSLTRGAIFNMPFPLVVINDKAKIIWYNSPFKDLFKDINLMNEDLESFIPELNNKNVLELSSNLTYPINVGTRSFDVFSANVSSSSKKDFGDNIVLFYFIDSTAYGELEEKYILEYPIIAKIEVDNFDDAIDSTESTQRPQLIAEIDSMIRDYFEDVDALVTKVDRESFMVIMDYGSLKEIKERRFDILDDLRELNRTNTISITLSIGVSSFGLSFKEAYIEAESSLDLALGRGGGQAVVKVGDNYEFFGGKSKAVEKRNKVKARVIGEALKKLIDRSENVYIMGHKNADMDAIGAAIGVYRASMNRNKQAYIVLDKSNPSIDNLIQRMKEEQNDLYSAVISRERAINTIKHSSLLILVDNHKPSFTECPELLDETTQIVVIDHHRRGQEFVKDPVLTYVEPYASSTCELITEILTYMGDELNLTHFEADAIMSGIVVDTKNFSFQTGVRTFEAASILRRAGADMLKVKALFEDDFDTMLYRAEVIHNTKIVYDYIAIGKFEKEASNSVLVASQAADALLDINGVSASFVMCINDGKIHISGRSRGEVISVQLILEKIGGGGHLNMAGAQLDTMDFDEAEKILNGAIDEYFIENKGEEI